jgi:hypothetical protein
LVRRAEQVHDRDPKPTAQPQKGKGRRIALAGFQLLHMPHVQVGALGRFFQSPPAGKARLPRRLRESHQPGGEFLILSYVAS